MIADDVVERVRQAADIVQIIGEYVVLKGNHGEFRGPCPFHQGTKPNFAVSAKRASYHCFVCQESGDVVTFLRKRLGVDFVGAIRLIGERVGIEVVDVPTRAHAPDPNEKNWEVLATAAEWFRAQLLDDAVGRQARAYLEGRGIDSAASAKFGIGFVPADAQLLRRHLNALGFDEARQLDAGLLDAKSTDAEPRARFRHRIMFPIVDEMGHHVAFGGRAMGDATPKYLNSSESSVYRKREVLYGLAHARNAMRRAGRAIVVEGYLDAIRLALSGVDEVVAPLGTALTEEQAELLLRYSREVFLMYDSDEAGQKATFRSGMELLRHKAAVRVVTMPDGDDPDTFVRREGRPGLETLLGQAIDLFDRQLQLVERRGGFGDLRRTRKSIDRLLPTIRAARDPLTHDLYVSRLADVSHIDKAIIAAEADEPPANSRGARAPRVVDAPQDARPEVPPPSQNDAPLPPAAPVRTPWTGRRGKPAPPEWQSTSLLPRVARDEPVERALIRAMLGDRDLVERMAERFGAEDFRDEHYGAIFSALQRGGHAATLEEIGAALPEDAFGVLRQLTDSSEAHPPEASDVSLSLARFAARRIELRIQELLAAMSVVSAEEQSALMRERLELEGELRRLLPMRSPGGNRKR